jgi:predicted  nucleic acid-binding Zn-ribbon protein
MNPDLGKLIALQRAEGEVRRVELALAEVPRIRGELEAALASERARLDAAKTALGDAQKTRKSHESALQDLEVKRSKYKGQLMEVKTNKEYTAMLHEIETVEREIREREDLILAEMEKAEALGGDVKREEGLYKVEEEKSRTQGKALDERERALQDEQKRIGVERDAIAATVPSEAMELFQRIARLRGVAVVEARDEMCQQCHVKLRPQMYMEVKRNDSIVQCPSCMRILYYEPPVPVIAPPGP